MYDVHMQLPAAPGALALMGAALGAAGISIEGGGVWHVAGRGEAHFLFRDGNAAAQVLRAAGISVQAVRPVVRLRLRQDQPGQMGALASRMAEVGVNLEVVYSDHDNRLVLVADDPALAARVASGWAAGSCPD